MATAASRPGAIAASPAYGCRSRVSGRRARLQRRFPSARESAPPPEVRAARDAIVALLAGVGRPISRPSRSTWNRCRPFIAASTRRRRTIPPGGTLTYGDIAAMLREPGAARAVGHALGREPVRDRGAVRHRVLAAGGSRWAASRPTAASRQSSVCSRWRKRVRKAVVRRFTARRGDMKRRGVFDEPVLHHEGHEDHEEGNQDCIFGF